MLDPAIVTLQMTISLGEVRRLQTFTPVVGGRRARLLLKIAGKEKNVVIANLIANLFDPL